MIPILAKTCIYEIPVEYSTTEYEAALRGVHYDIMEHHATQEPETV